MAVSKEYLTYVLDQLLPFARVVARRMFGGIGLYAEESFFGLIAGDVLYLKVNDSNRFDYQSRGCEPFRPIVRDSRSFAISYYQVPAEILEDSEELKVWARKSLAIALAAQQAPSKRDKRVKRAQKKRV